jgi:glycyl-tRNA synthetase beta chain
MADFLLELLSEEIPARMQANARADLARLFQEQLAAAGLKAEGVETYATPRRLALIARGLPAETEAVSEELKGPRTSAPPQALEGFLRKTGLTQDQLVERDGVWFALIDRPGRDTASVLAEAIPAIVRAFPWRKSMRWGEASASIESLRWVRPLQGIVALLGDDIVEFEIAGVKSGAATIGHRFQHPGIITIGGASDYVEKLRACHVIVDQAEREAIIREGAAKAAEAAGLTLVEDEGLMAENAGLTEWPVPLLGAFDPSFLEVPREVIQLTMRTNQKYFACTGTNGELAPNFVCTANIEAEDGGAAIVQGNEKVLAARLADARFFWDQDLKVPLEEQAKKLGDIVFHEKLGTVADKVERVAKLSRWVVEEGIVKGADADRAGTAARLAKADLVTGMVGEFPELQGVIGGYIARAQGQPEEVADAVRDHYKPVGQGDEVPTAPVTVAVSLADKLDSVLSFLSIDEAPTGSKDPFAIRRAVLGVVALSVSNDIRLGLNDLVLRWISIAYNVMKIGFDISAAENQLKTARNLQLKAIVDLLQSGEFEAIRQEAAKRLQPMIDPGKQPRFNTWLELLNRGRSDNWKELRKITISLVADRLKVQQREAGVRHDLIDAVFAFGGEDDLVRLLARVRALQSFVETPEGADLLAGYKRAANILKKEGWTSSEKKELSYAPLPEEAALIAALDSSEPRAAAAVEEEDFEGAMAALASLRGPVDAFFDKVTVNDPDRAKREVRLTSLARMRDAVHRVADFSRIEG